MIDALSSSNAFCRAPVRKATNAAQMKNPGRWRGWLLCLLLVVLYTPKVRLPGDIPVRIDDVLVFSAGGVLAVKYLLGFQTPKLDAVFLYTVVLTGTILLSTLLAPSNLGVTAKEYLDCLRPIKFFFVYWLIRDSHPATALSTFIRVLSGASFILFAIACIEMFFARTMPGGAVVRFFSSFTEKSPDLLLDMMASRPFATFNTPPELGYLACVCLFAGPFIHRALLRKLVVATFFLVLLITATRMLLFSLPLLMILQAFLKSKTAREAFRRLRMNLALIALAAVSSVVLLPLMSPHASDFTQSMIVSVVSGDTKDEDSITTRLGNLYLVDYTQSRAPLIGVGSRALLPEFVDSELILTFHRYGFIGLSLLLFIYPLGFVMARRIAGENPELYQFAVMALATTFLCGITLGALDNSRTGVFIFIILGLVRGAKECESGNVKGLVPSLG